jgi:geranylgeranyl diphosphate synthase, type II
MRPADDLRGDVEAYLASLRFAPELGELEAVLRYALESGGKRVRPILCLAVAEAAGGDVDRALPAAAAVELVHTFSLVHDDLPALDDDDERRGRPSAHVAYGEGVALLAGDALLAEAFRLVLSYGDGGIAAELADATLGMIGGQYLDVTGENADLVAVDRLKTGRLFEASVGLGLGVAGVPAEEQAPWRSFAEELGLLFQLVDDLLDADGLVERLGADATRRLADDAADRARRQLERLSGDTSVLGALVDELAARTG